MGIILASKLCPWQQEHSAPCLKLHGFVLEAPRKILKLQAGITLRTQGPRDLCFSPNHNMDVGLDNTIFAKRLEQSKGSSQALPQRHFIPHFFLFEGWVKAKNRVDVVMGWGCGTDPV